MNYEQDIIIDEQALDVEWLDQPQKMARYCNICADAHRDMDLAKEKLDYTYATIERDVRADPAAFGVLPGSRGITEDSIKAAIQVHDDYRKASRDHLDARHEYEVALGAVRAFDHRKSALENLVRLHGQSYFAGPSVPHDLSAERTRRDRDQLAQQNVKITPPSKPTMVRRRS